jgi:hypothetical protein
MSVLAAAHQSLLLIALALARAVPSDIHISSDAFDAWVISSNQSGALDDFDGFLRDNQVSGIIPDYQLLRTSSSWQRCRTAPFEIPPKLLWPNVLNALRSIRDDAVPAIGQVTAVSAFRNDHLNTCSGGKPMSAHREYFALDLLPNDPGLSRHQLITTLCALHGAKGAKYRIGLGFYDGVRFHVDGRRFRRWGPDGRSATSPCNAKS